MPKGFPQKILILSDEHRGASYSNFHQYQKGIMELLPQYDHIVDLGDNTELFYIDNNFKDQYAPLLDVAAGKGIQHWQRKIDKKSVKESPRVRGVIYSEKKWLQVFLENHPDVTFHKVLGNHEVVRRFRNELNELQGALPNFEWSPEAIRIGDALFTHSHLPLSGKTDAEYPEARLRWAERQGGARAKVEKLFYPFVFKNFVAPLSDSQKVSGRILAQLQEWSGQGDKFHYMQEGIAHPLKLDWVKHLFFGHTHLKFDNLEMGGVQCHNTGAFVEANAARDADLGVLEAKLNADGTITDVQPVHLEKDPVIIPRPTRQSRI